jgi:hypothetical protein
METIVNKVAESGILTIDIAHYLAKENELIGFDLKPFLFREMILREKDYREALKTHDWANYTNKHVYIHWANMLAVTYLQPLASSIFFGTKAELAQHLLLGNIKAMDKNEYADKRVVLKGCGDINIPAQGYVAISAHLLPVVKSLMYGEPCSTVPVYKKKN